jgi:hypothetical protein
MIAAAIRLRAHPLPSENAIMSKRVTLGVIVGNLVPNSAFRIPH